MKPALLTAIVTLAATGAFGATVDVSRLPAAARRPVEFTRDIQPIFERSCYSCHGSD